MRRFKLWWLPVALPALGMGVAFLYFTLSAGPLTFYASAADGLDLPFCGRTPVYPCASPNYVIHNLVPKKLDRVVNVNVAAGAYSSIHVSGFEWVGRDAGSIAIVGEVTRAQREAEAKLPPDHECSPSDGGAFRSCNNIYDNATVNGCKVNGVGANVTVVCPDGGTLHDVVFE